MTTQIKLSAIKQIPELKDHRIPKHGMSFSGTAGPRLHGKIWPAVLGEGAFLCLPIVQGRLTHPLQPTLGKRQQGENIGLITRGGIT